MLTVKSKCGSASKLDGATPATSSSSGSSVKITQTVRMMSNGVQTRISTRVKTEVTLATANAESEEDRVARRREHWRLKKREQRARLAARLAKNKDKVMSVITASAHVLLDASQGGKTQTLRKSARMARESMKEPTIFTPPTSIPRCRTARQRCLEAHRHLKVKSLSTPSPLKKRSIPLMDTKDTPEQIIAKQREYWRIKKQEQRAKMSMEAKARLKEKDSMMRRVKRYQKILEEMRRARASGVGLETIGGFIEEDGTVSANVPRTLNGIVRKDGLGASDIKVLMRAPARSKKSTPVQSFSHLTLACPQGQRKPDVATRVSRTGCVMKMLVSDKSLSKEDRIAKQREYWRVSKRQQRAALAARLRQGVAEAKFGPSVQRNKAFRPARQAPPLNMSQATIAVKQEPDLNPAPEQKLPLLVPKPEPEPTPAVDCQATTLLAVASMKKLLEESLSTVNDGKDEERHVGTKVKVEPDESELKEEPDESELKEEPDKSEVKEEPDSTELGPVVQVQNPDVVPRLRLSAAMSLQKKREYWKLMKRQQRARQKERLGKGRGNQAAALATRSINVAKTAVKLLPKPSLPLKSPETLAAKPPIHGDLDSALPTLKPPENPLSSIILHPIEPPALLKWFWPSPAPVNTLRPPKRQPEESDEDFLKRKREYWRIKKKEQRHKKSMGEKGNPQRSGTCVPPAQNLQDFCQRAMSDPLSEASEHLISNSVNTAADTHYTAPLQDEPLAGDERPSGDGGHVSEATWRNFYLMDYDPLNQLLVCMACGQLQHSQSLEAVMAHIDEAHPHTRSLEPAERRRILEAWDEQVSRRERFFTRQLQQRNATLAETYRN
ncbi:uncharacterized protein LOC144004241 [Festucalex cinctus]